MTEFSFPPGSREPYEPLLICVVGSIFRWGVARLSVVDGGDRLDMTLQEPSSPSFESTRSAWGSQLLVPGSNASDGGGDLPPAAAELRLQLGKLWRARIRAPASVSVRRTEGYVLQSCTRIFG